MSFESFFKGKVKNKTSAMEAFVGGFIFIPLLSALLIGFLLIILSSIKAFVIVSMLIGWFFLWRFILIKKRVDWKL